MCWYALYVVVHVHVYDCNQIQKGSYSAAQLLSSKLILHLTYSLQYYTLKRRAWQDGSNRVQLLLDAVSTQYGGAVDVRHFMEAEMTPQTFRSYMQVLHTEGAREQGSYEVFPDPNKSVKCQVGAGIEQLE